MNFPLFIAWRYLFSKKTRNIINIITTISMMAVMVVSAALIILLSAFNGLESKVVALFNAFDPPLKVTPLNGKSFEISDATLTQIRGVQGVNQVSRIVEESVLFTYGEQQHVGVIKGVEPAYLSFVRLDTMLEEGSAELYFQNQPVAIVAEGVSAALGINLMDPQRVLTAYYPKRGGVDLLQPFREARIRPGGVFFIQQEYNESYVIVPLPFAQSVTGYDTEINALEIDLDPNVPLEQVQAKVQEIVGSEAVVKNRFEQHELMYKVMKLEKMAVFLVVTFIVIIASFNIIGALTMLIVEKRKDIMVLWSLGADFRTIKWIYTLEGTLVSFIGCVTGILLGLLIVWLQYEFGFVRLTSNPESNAYPVVIKFSDVLLTFVTVVSIGFFASWLRMRLLQFSKADGKALLK